MQKKEYITELYRETLERITVNAEAWRAFLRSAAYQYKYPFSDQILIYAQKPSATACASLELWNKRFGRWINRSATGIALLREKNGRCSLDHVFDVSDTHHRENEPFAVWSIRPEYEADVIEVLQNRFIDDGKPRDKVSDAVLAAAENLGTDNITDYLQELSYGKEGSLLEELDDDNIRARLLITVQASVAYAVLTRLGYDADRLVDKDSFAWVYEFNTPAAVNILGNAASDISEICLREIERTVKSIERSIQKENRTFDSQVEKGDTEGETKEHGGKTYGAELQNGKRHEIPESGAARSDELSNREVRSDEAELSKGASQGNLHDSTDRGRAEPASPRDRRDGESADIAEYIPDGTEPWGVGADESREPDALGGDDEQYQGGSGGGSADGYDLRLSLKAFPAPDEKTVIAVLRHGERLRESKADIVSFLRSESDENKKTEYVKSIYPTEVREEFILPENKEHIGYYARADEFVIYQGEYATRTHEAVFSWDLTRRLIEALIKDKNYLDKPVPQAEHQISFLDTDLPVEEVKPSAENEIPESEYNLHLGTTVYIGKNECDILLLSKEKVELFDGTLIPLELDYETFMRRLRENPLNDALLKEPKLSKAEQITEKQKKRSNKPNSSKRRKNTPSVESLIQSIENTYASWEKYRDEGGSDPSWADGVNMNLLRNHIIYYRKQLEELSENGERPDILNRALPPEMPNDYMANADEIREAAGKSLEVYRSNPTYQWCIEQAKRIPEKLLKKTVIPNILGYVSGLESSIRNDDLVSMRRHRDPQGYMDSFERCKQEIEKLLPQIERERMTDDIYSAEPSGDKPSRYSEDVHIYIDTDREELIWTYYNPDAESGGQFVTSSLAFKVFKEAYDDFSENGGDWSNKAARENFINRIGEMADQRLADVNTPFFTEAEAFYEEEPDYIGFTSENIQQIGQNIENHIVDLEAERELNAHEAEFGADGYRAFPGNRPEQENLESLSIWQRYEKAKQLYPEAVAAIRVGDFYEFFGEDAERVSKLLDLMLTSRQTDSADRVPMCGIPFHVTDKYFSKLLDAGIRIAVDDDDLTPKIILPNTRKQAGRFVVVESEDIAGDPYEVWDEEKNAIHIDENGNRSTFISRWQADNFASELNRWEYERTRDHSGELFYEDTEPDENTASESDAASQKYDLGFGFLGNGLSVWNRLQNEHGDYKTIAHIATDRTVRFYDRNIPESVKKRIYEVAATSDGRISETQDIPIFSTSKLDRIPLQEDEPEIRETIPQLAVQPKPQKTNRVYAFHPEIPDSEKRNYRITDDEIGMGGAKEKFRKNIAAIKLLYQLEAENRLASPDEQEILAQYSGWGGLAEAFDDTKDNWYQEYNELKALLSTEEYEAAKESTLTAFYTPPVVIKAIYQAIENMGFVRGNVLEPSCGIGNFMGLVPEHMDAKMYGVELDSLSGRIARQLYQKNSITIDGYEKTQFPDSFFDVAIGNVPFGDFKVADRRYDKYHFLIHDYYFAKTLDNVRPGGIIAFITSSGTMDKENPSVRKYISQRADFLGAIRLPNNTFDGAGANKVVSDIIFLQKRDRIVEKDEDWVHLGKDENGIPMNQYFVDHPDMVLGEMVMRSGPYGPESTCRAYEGQDLGELLAEAVSNIHAEIPEVDIEELSEGTEIPADPTVKNFSFTIVDGKVYYRQNSIMNSVETSVTGENRIKGMIGIRDTVKSLIEAQLEDYPESEIKALQSKLNRQYDAFTAKYGLINSRGNAAAFDDDSSYFLLCSLEILDENKELRAKADMFTKRTIRPQITVDRVDTASEALAVSMGEKTQVNMEYMCSLTGKTEQEIYEELKGVIFLNPMYGYGGSTEQKYLMADEYLSGNVREKLDWAKKSAEIYPEDYKINVEALEKVQPKDLTPSEIGVRLGSTWVPQEDVQAFMYELLETPYRSRRKITVHFIPITAQWLITEKSYDRANIKAYSTYGTKRINAYHIIEETLNLRNVRIFDYIDDGNGNEKAVLNKNETAIAQGKQEQIRRAFDEWIWKDPERRARLCKLYNERFNSLRPREFDGSHIRFYGMNPGITLRRHQINAVARIIYGGNSLLAHVVGAGKTFTMVAAAQEMKRLGLCHKSMFVVPNHLIEQWASEYLQLYPSANILVATKKDFETKNRKKFCARIATGDYDAVIIGHSQFEKIPMSLKHQVETLTKERDNILQIMNEAKSSRNENVTVKQLARARKQIEVKLKKLNDQSRKDDVVTFEELGVDRLFVDEAHFYKNLASFSKMRNVAGIAQTEAQKSSDLYMKCRYLDELTGAKGCIFATGTPISNTMVELYTMQKYLQYDELQLRGLLNFDAWASTFGETVTAIELAPDGSGYRAKTRFAKFFNIPELMAMFKQVADVQTADMLKLPVPEAHFHVVKVKASDIQKELVDSFAERAEKVHNRMVDSSVDNMLLITNDGRKAALDQRLLNPALPDFEDSKVNTCVRNVYEIWERNADKKSAQLVFCDLSTPKGDGSFNVYDDIRNKLIGKGIPPEEIAFIHTADTDAKKKELFAKVRAGQVRILMGSTFKMGAGTNVRATRS